MKTYAGITETSAPTSMRFDENEKQALMDALVQTGGNQTRAARILGINRVTGWNRMRKYGIDLKRVIQR